MVFSGAVCFSVVRVLSAATHLLVLLDFVHSLQDGNNPRILLVLSSAACEVAQIVVKALPLDEHTDSRKQLLCAIQFMLGRQLHILISVNFVGKFR
jgi:hypothetical protein